MQQIKKRVLAVIGLSILACIAFVFIFQTYSVFISSSIRKDATGYLTEINKQASSAIKQQIQKHLSILEVVATSTDLDVNDVATRVGSLRYLNSYGFKHIGIATSDGTAYTANSKFSIINQAFFASALDGNSFVSFRSFDMTDYSQVAVFAVPLLENGGVQGVLFAAMDYKTIDQLLDPHLFDENGNLFIIDRKAQIMFASKPDEKNLIQHNDFTMTDEFANTFSPSIKNSVLADISQNKSGIVSFQRASETLYLCYTPLGVQDFYVCTIIQDATINTQSKYITIVTFLFFGLMMLAFIILCIFIIRSQNKSKRKIQKTKLEFETVIANIPGGVVQFTYDDNLTIAFLNDGLLTLTGYSEEEIKSVLNNSFLNFVHDDDRQDLASAIVDQMTTKKTVEIDCRLKCNNGEYSWFLFKGRMIVDSTLNATCICVLTDINDTKRAQQELNLSMQRYRIVTEQSDSVVFEYSFVDQKIYLSDQWDKKFHFQSNQPDFLNIAKETQLLHPDDNAIFYQLFHAIHNGEKYGECEVRFAQEPGKYIWCRIKASAIYNEKGIVHKTVGKIVDIDEEKKETEKLKQKAENDSLTGLYNKGTTKMLIEDFLMNEGRNGAHALMILDIDDFKKVNDTLGHLVGDSVIIEVTSNLKNSLRSSDICGRIGGDEFVALLKNTPTIECVKTKANEICAGFRQTVCSETSSIDISGSIGIAFFDKDGATYHELIDKADTALYEAKKRGKNQYRFYGAD